MTAGNDPEGTGSAGTSGGIGGFFSALDAAIKSPTFDKDLGRAAQFSSLGILSQAAKSLADAAGLDGPDGTGDPGDAGGADIGPPGTAEGEGGDPSTPPGAEATTNQQDQAAAAAHAEAEAQAQAEAEAAAAAEEAERQKALEDEKKRRDAAEKEAETKARQRAKKDADDAAGAVGLGLEGGFVGGRRVRTTPLGLTGVRANVFRPTLLGG